MNISKLNLAIESFVKKQKTKSTHYAEGYEERKERISFYQAYTSKRILRMTEDDLYEYISKLWSMLIWGNKQYVVDKLIADIMDLRL
jgi:hypothetical protein